jgi:hypothetical protein
MAVDTTFKGEGSIKEDYQMATKKKAAKKKKH